MDVRDLARVLLDEGDLPQPLAVALGARLDGGAHTAQPAVDGLIDREVAVPGTDEHRGEAVLAEPAERPAELTCKDGELGHAEPSGLTHAGQRDQSIPADTRVREQEHLAEPAREDAAIRHGVDHPLRLGHRISAVVVADRGVDRRFGGLRRDVDVVADRGGIDVLGERVHVLDGAVDDGDDDLPLRHLLHGGTPRLRPPRVTCPRSRPAPAGPRRRAPGRARDGVTRATRRCGPAG